LTKERSVQIQCPECETTFQLDENQLGESGSKVRCSRCGRVFWAEAPAEKEAPLPEEVSLEEANLPPEDELRAAFQEPPRRRRVGGMIGFFFLLLLLVVTVRYSYLQLLQPEQEFGETVKKVFFLDSDPRGAKKIRLREVKGFFKNHSPEGRFFVVEGKVVNGYNDLRDSIRLRGNLKNAAQQVVATREVEAGWSLIPEELETLSFPEINTLAAGQPKRFSSKIRLAPSAAAPFMMIFPPSSQTLAEFSVEVVGSQKSAAAAGPAR
jgi:predicted Zn finger-like uncharacterized protein